jgi:outer membrane protein TolC
MLYWSYYERLRLLSISTNALSYASEQAERARIRFRIGEAAVLDTLSATLEYLSARESLLNDKMAATRARDEFARALGIAADSITMPDSLTIAIEDLPQPDTFISLVERYDPQLRIFEVMKQRLETEYRHTRNALLPDLTARAEYATSTRLDDQSLKGNSVVSLVFAYVIPQTQKKVAVARKALEIKSQSLDVEDYRVQLRASLTEMVDNWRLEKEKSAISSMSRDIALQSFNASSRGYELGTVDRLNMLKAQNDFVDKSIRALQQQITLKKLEITVDELTGNVFTKFGVTLQ